MLAERLEKVVVTLRGELDVSRHVFRDGPAYVVRDPVSFSTHSFTPEEYAVLGRITESSPLGEIFASLVEDGVLEPGESEDFYGFVVELHRAGLLSLPVSDSESLYRKFAARRRAARRGLLFAILSFRVPLFDPDRFLDRTAFLVRPLFTRAAFAIWCVIMALAATTVCARWSDFRSPIGSLLLAENVALLWVLLVGLKVVHEFGHAYACKILGGRVPEIGALFMLMTPCAYVDATDSWSFPSQRHRLIVALAGMYVESIAGAVALLIWATTGPGLVHTATHQIVLLSSAVTIGFNINPLMRFDGYYILSDLVNIPNLRAKAQEQIRRIFERVALGIRGQSTKRFREALLLSGFGVASSIYKTGLTLSICGLIATKFYFIGLGLAAAYLVMTVGGAMFRFLRYLWVSEATSGVRWRAVTVGAAAVIGVPALAGMAPIAIPVFARGVIEREASEPICAAVSGELETISARAGGALAPGDEIARLSNPDIVAQLEEARAEHDLAVARFDRAIALGGAGAPERKAVDASAARLTRAKERAGQLVVSSDQSGRCVEVARLRHGAYVSAGQRLATVARGAARARIALPAAQLDRAGLVPGTPVQCRLVRDPTRVLSGTVAAVNPGGSREVMRTELTHEGGGEILTDPRSGLAGEPYFDVVIELREPLPPGTDHGSGIEVRLDGRAQTLVRHGSQRIRAFLDSLATR